MACEISIYRIQLVKASRKFKGAYADSPGAVSKIMRQYLSGADREHFVVLLLNAKLQVTGINTVSIGSLNNTCVHPREVFKPAILANASSVILAHNHPSGDATPSEEDILLTKRLRDAGEILGIEVVDHIIVGDYLYKP